MKAWSGRITGNDEDWILPPLVAGHEPSYRKSPLPLTEQKAKILATVLKDEAPSLKRLFIQPLVVLATNTSPELEGRCAEHTIVSAEVVESVLVDPRPGGFKKQKVPEDVAERATQVLVGASKPLIPASELGSWRLVEQIEVGPAWEVWTAVPKLGGKDARSMRLKRYFIDPLLTGDERDVQRDRARRDLDSLERLAGAFGVVPPVSAIEDVEGSLVMVTEWPGGESLASLIAAGELETDDAEDVFEAFVGALASVHRLGVVHRNLSPRCAHYLPNGTVVLTDFDYARLPTREGEITEYIGEELDADYRAPEIREGAAKATKASDVWSAARIALALFGDGSASDSEVLSKMNGRWRETLTSSLVDDPGARIPDAEILAEELFAEAASPLPLFEGFQPNDELDDRFVVRGQPIETGGLTRVYKVHDSVTGQDYAAKFVRPEFKELIDPSEEHQLLFNVPDAPGLVKPEFAPSLKSFRRGKKEYKLSTTFLLTRWVEGVRLDRLMTEGLPPARCVEIVLDICRTVEHLHSHKLLHRDLKPQNVIIDSVDGRPRIVDFNVSRDQELADRTLTGTVPYRPPDNEEVGWSRGSDTYAIAYILCELLAGKPLRPSVADWLDQSDAPPALDGLLRRATDPSAGNRFKDTSEFSEALALALDEIEDPPIAQDPAPFPVAADEELARPNWNPYQNQLVSLFSQSRATNAGTRGLDDFARWAYVDTLIDRDLLPKAIGGSKKLVIITGNAGDGKTAFIQILESHLEIRGGDVTPRSDGNGAMITLGSHRFITNWDGSQDEGEQDNSEVLTEFFGPFAGKEPAPEGDETRVIAINEGRLLDFLAERRNDFGWLSSRILEFFTMEIPIPENWFTVVNLNLRALTADAAEESTIVDRLLAKFSDERVWEPCEKCAARNQCYARSNAAALRHPTMGPITTDRIRQTLDVVRLRRRLHITMRDLRSALAFIVAGNRTCDEIVSLVENTERDELIAGHAYNALFAASGKFPRSGRSSPAAQDRLLSIVGSLDVAKTADPEDDSKLWSEGTNAIRPDPAGLARSDRPLLDDLKSRLPQGAEALKDRRAKSDLRFLQASLRRKLFLEREDPGWIDMLPYERLGVFKRQLSDPDPGDRDEIARAISQSEGMFVHEFDDRIAVRLASDVKASERSFVLHPIEEFEFRPLDRSVAAKHVEYAPDTLRLNKTGDATVYLDIDLDLFETLTRILEGFTPSREELRGTWLNLRVFKEALASIPTDSLLLTDGEDSYFRLQRANDAQNVSVERV